MFGNVQLDCEKELRLEPGEQLEQQQVEELVQLGSEMWEVAGWQVLSLSHCWLDTLDPDPKRRRVIIK